MLKNNGHFGLFITFKSSNSLRMCMSRSLREVNSGIMSTLKETMGGKAGIGGKRLCSITRILIRLAHE
jgi:hypothetical protein